MKLSDMLSADAVRIPLHSRAKDDVLRELVTLLPIARDEDKLEKVYAAIVEREKRMSTGIGQGIAIPHGKCDVVDEMEIAFGLAPAPIEFEALDGAPVGIFFLLVSPPDMTGPHLKALAQIRRVCHGLLRLIREAHGLGAQHENRSRRAALYLQPWIMCGSGLGLPPEGRPLLGRDDRGAQLALDLCAGDAP